MACSQTCVEIKDNAQIKKTLQPYTNNSNEFVAIPHRNLLLDTISLEQRLTKGEWSGQFNIYFATRYRTILFSGVMAPEAFGRVK